jgi:hypothetical protein
MTAEELTTYFTTATLPKEARLHPAVLVVDVPRYVAVCLDRLAHGPPRLQALALSKLEELYCLINS